MSRGFLIIDGSNLGHAANNATPLKVGDQPTQAIFGFFRMLRPLVAQFPMLTPIVLWDGMSWRYTVFPEYKQRRSRPPQNKTEEKAAAIRAQFKPQLPHIKRGLKLLGVRQMHALNYEADDLAGLLIERYQPQGKTLMLISADTDWAQLLGKGVGMLDPIRGKHFTAKTLEQKLGYQDKDGNFIGVPSPAAWLEIKALMGDTTDDIPGCGGIGQKGAINLIRQYGSVTSFKNQYVDGSINRDEVPKKYADLIEDNEKMDRFVRNLRLMDLRTKDRPPPVSPKIESGSFDLAGFESFCHEFAFNSMVTNLTGWTEPFAPKALEEAA